jgi:hypothetical protein
MAALLEQEIAVVPGRTGDDLRLLFIGAWSWALTLLSLSMLEN